MLPTYWYLHAIQFMRMAYLSTGPGRTEHFGERVGCIDQLGLDAKIASVDLDPQLPARTDQAGLAQTHVPEVHS